MRSPGSFDDANTGRPWSNVHHLLDVVTAEPDPPGDALREHPREQEGRIRDAAHDLAGVREPALADLRVPRARRGRELASRRQTGLRDLGGAVAERGLLAERGEIDLGLMTVEWPHVDALRRAAVARNRRCAIIDIFARSWRAKSRPSLGSEGSSAASGSGGGIGVGTIRSGSSSSSCSSSCSSSGSSGGGVCIPRPIIISSAKSSRPWSSSCRCSPARRSRRSIRSARSPARSTSSASGTGSDQGSSGPRSARSTLCGGGSLGRWAPCGGSLGPRILEVGGSLGPRGRVGMLVTSGPGAGTGATSGPRRISVGSRTGTSVEPGRQASTGAT